MPGSPFIPEVTALESATCMTTSISPCLKIEASSLRSQVESSVLGGALALANEASYSILRTIKLKTLQARSSFCKRRQFEGKGCTGEELEIRFAERVRKIAIHLQLFWSQLVCRVEKQLPRSDAIPMKSTRSLLGIFIFTSARR